MSWASVDSWKLYLRWGQACEEMEQGRGLFGPSNTGRSVYPSLGSGIGCSREAAFCVAKMVVRSAMVLEVPKQIKGGWGEKVP